MLPPTRTTLMPHVVRNNFICMRDKSYVSPNPRLSSLEENGWLLQEGVYIPNVCKCFSSVCNNFSGYRMQNVEDDEDNDEL